MKKFLVLFGILDLITVLKNYNNFYRLVFPNNGYHWLNIVILLIYMSLIISGYLLIRQKKSGIWFSYFQFPLRLLFALFTFGFLMILNRFINDQQIGIQLFTGLLAVLEIGRFIVTIMIHRKYFIIS
jgi:hypothetical protein